MEKPAERALVDAITAADPLTRTLRAQNQFEALNRELRPAFSAVCRDHVQVACVNGQTLVLAAASSAWAGRVRLEAANALQVARRLWPGPLEQVQVIVVPPLLGDGFKP